MQLGEHQFNHGRVFFGMQAIRNAPAVIFDADRAIAVQRDFDLFAMTGQGLIGRVVQHFLNDVQRIVRARVHAGTLFNRLQSFENADGTF